MMFNFQLVGHIWTNNDLGKFEPNIPNLLELKKIFKDWQIKLKDKGWNTLFWENHDLARCISNYGNDRFYRVESAKALAYMLYFQQGTPYIYQGQEIGMVNAYFSKLEDYQDIDSLNFYEDRVNIKKDVSHSRLMHGLARGSRDNARTPMQWDDSINAGFNKGGKPWLKVIPNYKEINVKSCLEDEDSILYTYKKIFDFRKNSMYKDAILYGSYDTYDEDNPNIFTYGRTYQNKKFIVVVNFDDRNNNYNLDLDVKEIIMSNYKDSKCTTRNVVLRPYEAIVFKVE